MNIFQIVEIQFVYKC